MSLPPAIVVSTGNSSRLAAFTRRMFKVNIEREEKLVRDRRIIERQGSRKVTVTFDAVRPRCSRERQNQRHRMTIPNVVEARRILVAPS